MLFVKCPARPARTGHFIAFTTLTMIGLGDMVRLAVTWPAHRTRVHKNPTAKAAIDADQTAMPEY